MFSIFENSNASKIKYPNSPILSNLYRLVVLKIFKINLLINSVAVVNLYQLIKIICIHVSLSLQLTVLNAGRKYMGLDDLSGKVSDLILYGVFENV